VAAARIGDGGQERLVEVGTHAEGAGADARRPQVRREGGQRGRIGDADVGQPIGQEQRAVDALGGGVPLQRIGPGGPAAVQVGRASRVDLLEAQQRLRPVGRRRQCLWSRFSVEGNHDSCVSWCGLVGARLVTGTRLTITQAVRCAP
jgi:hypothetical protein